MKDHEQTKAVTLNVGSTLVQLLVVIAIVAILASMLLPALSKAKTKGTGIVSLNNLKQLGLSWVMYAEENNEKVPPNGADPNNVNTTWVRGLLDLSNSPDTGTTGSKARFRGRCPGALGLSFRGFCVQSPAVHACAVSNARSVWECGDSSPLFGRRLVAVERPGGSEGSRAAAVRLCRADQSARRESADQSAHSMGSETAVADFCRLFVIPPSSFRSTGIRGTVWRLAERCARPASQGPAWKRSDE